MTREELQALNGLADFLEKKFSLYPGGAAAFFEKKQFFSFAIGPETYGAILAARAELTKAKEETTNVGVD